MGDLYRTVTDQIIAELKIGVRLWVQPWSQTPGLNIPANAVTGRPYSGVNTLLLWTARRNNWPRPRSIDDGIPGTPDTPFRAIKAIVLAPSPPDEGAHRGAARLEQTRSS